MESVVPSLVMIGPGSTKLQRVEFWLTPLELLVACLFIYNEIVREFTEEYIEK